MLDVRRFRAEPEIVRAGLARRGEDPSVVDRVVDLDGRHRRLVAERDELRARVRALSGEVGVLMREGRNDEATELQAESRALGDDERRLDTEVDGLAAELRDLLLRTPNLPADEAPDGLDESANVVVRTHGPDPGSYAEHQRVPHWDTGAALGILDLERGAKLSGSMFVMYRRAGATLARALCQLALDRAADAYEEIRPPTIVRTETMVSTGHLPKFEDEAYHVERDDLWAIPTAEVPLTSLARDEILTHDDLPFRLCAYTPCFRREAGAAGKDTRGLLRVHEFDKVELLAYATAEQAPAMHAEILERAERTIAELGLTYRILDLCAGDLGASSARTFDIEVWSPGVQRWLEVSSVSWFSDYQARRANVRYRLPTGKGTEMCHTLNGSALAVPRVWAALVEVYRQPDGTVRVPELLRPYLRGLEVITAPGG